MYQFSAELGLDARQAESGSKRDSRNERERGERTVMEADKVRNWVRGRRLGHRCMRSITGEASVSSTGQTGKGKKEEPCDVVSMAGVLPISQDPDDAQDMVGLESVYRGSRTSRSGVECPGVDAGKSSDSNGRNGKRGRQIATKQSMGDEDNGRKSASNASRSSPLSLPGTGVLTLSSSSSSFASSSSLSSLMALAQYVLVATNPWPFVLLPLLQRPCGHAYVHHLFYHHVLPRLTTLHHLHLEIVRARMCPLARLRHGPGCRKRHCR